MPSLGPDFFIINPVSTIVGPSGDVNMGPISWPGGSFLPAPNGTYTKYFSCPVS
jgi:hypothetical protein